MSQKGTKRCSFLLFSRVWAVAASSIFPTAFTRPLRATKSSPAISGKFSSPSCGLSPQREGRESPQLGCLLSSNDPFIAPARYPAAMTSLLGRSIQRYRENEDHVCLYCSTWHAA